jgi:uncharacterized protein (TIGR00369 family)
MADMLELGRRVLASQPFGVLTGTELIVLEPGRAELALTVRDTLRQQHGFVHGGVVSYLADSAITFAAGSLFGDALTLELKTNYVQPARGERLIARALVVHRGRRHAVVRCDVFASEAGAEHLCAVAQGSVSSRAAADEVGTPADAHAGEQGGAS